MKKRFMKREARLGGGGQAGEGDDVPAGDEVHGFLAENPVVELLGIQSVRAVLQDRHGGRLHRTLSASSGRV